MDRVLWGSSPHPDIDYLIGLDLAQGGLDYTAIAVLERLEPITGEPATYQCIWLDRWRSRDTDEIPKRVRITWRQLERMARQRELERTGRSDPGFEALIRLVVDQTGVGPFGLDPLRKANFDPTGIVIHGGDIVSHPDVRTWRVPKRDLAGAVHTLLQANRLRIAKTLPEAAILRAELENFRVKININTGHDSYGAGTGEEWREGEHDDLVLAVAVAAWLGEVKRTPRLDPVIAAAWTDLPR